MVNTSIRLGVALATLFNVAVVTANENPRSLDTTGGTAKDTGFLGMLVEENNFDHGNSITERKKCPATRQCTNAGGSCMKSKAFCGGNLDPKGCKGNKCKCCIPDQTTPAPLTCPTCPASSTCPTTPAPSTCPTCPAPPTCPTSPVPLTCPTCQTCPEISEPTCEPCPTRAATIIPVITSTPDITKTPAATTTPVMITTLDITTTPAATTTPVMITTTDITITPALTTIIAPGGFDIFNNRLIRRPIYSDPKYTWDAAMTFCDQFGAAPFIPRAANEYDLYKTVRAALERSGYIWLPANDRAQEGTLRWCSGDIDTNITLWDWYKGQDLYLNSETRNCLFYGYGDGPKVNMAECNEWTAYPPICEIL